MCILYLSGLKWINYVQVVKSIHLFINLLFFDDITHYFAAAHSKSDTCYTDQLKSVEFHARCSRIEINKTLKCKLFFFVFCGVHFKTISRKNFIISQFSHIFLSSKHQLKFNLNWEMMRTRKSFNFILICLFSIDAPHQHVWTPAKFKYKPNVEILLCFYQKKN